MGDDAHACERPLDLPDSSSPVACQVAMATPHFYQGGGWADVCVFFACGATSNKDICCHGNSKIFMNGASGDEAPSPTSHSSHVDPPQVPPKLGLIPSTYHHGNTESSLYVSPW